MEILFVFLIVENIIEKYFPVFSYSDELITLVMLFFLIIKVPSLKIYKTDLKIALWFFGFLLVGGISTALFRTQNNGLAIMKDILAVSKFFVVYLFGVTMKIPNESERMASHLTIFSKIYITVLFLFGVTNQFFNIGMASGYRGFIKTFAFLYSHTTFMVASVVILCSILISQGFSKNRLSIMMAIIVLVFSMRSKAFVYIVALIVLGVLFHSKKLEHRISNEKKNFSKKIKRRSFLAGLIILIIGYFIVRNKVSGYLSWGLMAARPALYIVGLEIFRDYFPLGAGFGSFASSISGQYYSPLYYKYGIADISGLQLVEGYPYMSDTYWPYIIGQYGFLGTFAYLAALYNVFKDIFRMYRSHINQLLAALTLFIYLISGSFVESMFTNSTIVLVALTLSYYIRIMDTHS